MNNSVIRLTGVAACAAILLSACSKPEPTPEPAAPVAATPEPAAPVTRIDTTEVTATILAIDKEHRLVTLHAADGHDVVLALSDEVRNFDQMKVGDVVSVTYYEAIGVAMSDEDKAKGAETVASRVRASEGERPGMAMGELTTVTVVIESTDNALHTVTFKRADGSVRTINVKDPAAQEFVSKLKQGDKVDVSYAEAVAVEVKPAK